MGKKGIFIAATGQNVGKTTLCLGMIAGLQKRFSSIGFIKPVGQQHVAIAPGINIDKDVLLFKDYFHLSAAYEEMSPVIFPAGFTRRYLDGEIQEKELRQKIQSAFDKIAQDNPYTIVEGTGHVGVGAIVNMNNASIAAQLGLPVVIIAQGGLGSAYDELALNIAMCHAHGIVVKGVILNRVLKEKKEMILNYFPKALKQWNIPLIGAIPYSEFLSTPCMKDFELLFDTTLLSGQEHRLRHFAKMRLVAGSVESYREEICPKELIITPACRSDIIATTIDKQKEAKFESGMILTGKIPPNHQVKKMIEKADIPILYTPLCSYDAMKKMTSFTAKIRKEDLPKIEQTIKIVEENVDFEIFRS